MRIVIIVTLLLPCRGFAIEADKKAHMQVSAFLTLPAYMFCKGMKKKNAGLCAFTGVMLIGLVKELGDKNPDIKDVGANIIGASIILPF